MALSCVVCPTTPLFNWPALPDTIVPDFPLTNMSFNLSYSDSDL
ncbi:hypothetical protein ACWC9T_39140 [Kitasatospora sp. NPDC001159]